MFGDRCDVASSTALLLHGLFSPPVFWRYNSSHDQVERQAPPPSRAAAGSVPKWLISSAFPHGAPTHGSQAAEPVHRN